MAYLLEITLAVTVGTLLAIVFSMRYLVMMERRVANMDRHIEKIAKSILSEEIKIEKGIRKKRR